MTETVPQTSAEFRSISIAVNLSAKLVMDDRFNRAFNMLMDGQPQTIGRLTFKITETAAVPDMAAAVNTLTTYRSRCISISMDDYGFGQSTLSDLRKLSRP